MVLKGLTSLFGLKDEPQAASSPPGPFALSLGRAVSLDTLRLRLEEGRLARGLPPQTLVVTGHGVAMLDASGILHRYYDDDGNMLQVLCLGGVDDASIREITLYHLWDEVVPASEAEWAAWDGPDGRIGAAVFEADGFRFDRVWGEPTTPWIPPAEFTEDIAVDEGPRKQVYQKIMPYRREVGSVVETLIIAVERDLASLDRGSVTFMIGYGLAAADVSPV
jgi:hypothetical protein